MYQSSCKKCGSMKFYTEVKGNNTGLYCNNCGKWIKWLSKGELRAFELKAFKHNEKTKGFVESEDSKDMIARLKEFIVYLDKTIDDEMSKMPLSPEDAIRKSSYCLALERDKGAVINILNGKDFGYVGDK